MAMDLLPDECHTLGFGGYKNFWKFINLYVKSVIY